ncbi:uncharacterized protein LOC123300619 [Chrysoperla carnea]|uniref:uncharacterized protein LOC123300619 n=1 Tax=Chrysoperla carnea TaxID=189513 RepID=UPI001D06D286|nr:uncharacterized protein LOC123300619 [Chrysoperla carnea]
MSSDSSSEDENITKLQEALDTSFINNNMYSNLNKDVTKKKPERDCKDKTEIFKKQVSLRPDKKCDLDEFSILKVTPEFQEFVAKNLRKLLDKEIDLYTSQNDPKATDNNTGGIKLFSNSTVILKDNENYDLEISSKKPKKTSNENEIDLDEQIKSVAVSPDDILSKKDTLFWSKRTKRKPFVYKKLSNGKLELVE